MRSVKTAKVFSYDEGQAVKIPEEYTSQYVVGKLYPCILEPWEIYFTGDKATIREAIAKWNDNGEACGEQSLDDLLWL